MSNQDSNRLIFEKSPYLLQHAHNPVDWYPWGDEAFERARIEQKPVFLSIGYSTCHWCHVMAHESFEDPRVARLMNEAFVSVKVDREERPDIDGLYLSACQMLTGSGGWPLTIVMTPDQQPFFAATYIPRETRFGRLGMLELVPQLRRVWEQRRDDLLHSARRIAGALHQARPSSPQRDLDEKVLASAYESLSDRFDEQHGGFGAAPKFPTPHQLTFLLRYWRRTGESRALTMVEKTLQAMRRGGLYDHIGFGFHRYATDSQWLVPHFEKMLYDQALLTMAYAEAYQATGAGGHRKTAEEIISYVLRDLASAEGGFFSAEDADSEGQEGRFYLWTVEAVRQALPPEEARFCIDVFGLAEGGNVGEDAVGRKTGQNILHLKRSTEDLSADLKIPAAVLQERLEAVRAALFERRAGRPRPHRDEKVLADWNGLMIAALAQAGRAFGRPDYITVACRAADFLLAALRSGERLHHRFRDGEVAIPGFVDDYAFAVWGLLETYQATFEVRYLKAALQLNQEMIEHFWDEKEGGCFVSGDDAEPLLLRRKEIYDGAVPSGNSVALSNLLRLGRMTGQADYEERALQMSRAFSADIETAPSAFTHFLAGLDLALGGSVEIVIVGDRESADTRALWQALNRGFHPGAVLLHRPGDNGSSALEGLADYTREMTSRDGRATAYVCRNRSCRRPTTDAAEMLALVAEESLSSGEP